MSKRKPTIISSEAGTVRIEGRAQGVVVGNGARVDMTFNGDADPEIIVHRGTRVDVPAPGAADLLRELLGIK